MLKRDPKQIERITGYIKDKYGVPDIIDREGGDPKVISDLCREIGQQLGIKPVQGHTDLLPYGLSSSGPGAKLRSTLGNHLFRLTKNHHFREVSVMTGLTNAEQKRALNNPPRHDWSLSQIERMAKARNITFLEVLNDPTD